MALSLLVFNIYVCIFVFINVIRIFLECMQASGTLSPMDSWGLEMQMDFEVCVCVCARARVCVCVSLRCIHHLLYKSD